MDRIIDVRKRFKYLGPRKLRALLCREQPEVIWPAASTIGDILKRAKLIDPVRRRRPSLDQHAPFTTAEAANDEWCTDFKGWFRTRDQQRIDPLTISDGHTRFLIAVRIVPPTMEGVRPVFEAAFRAYGLPRVMRCDNGPPFGSPGAGGLTQLSVWWLKLGIQPLFIHPGSPQENGRHERMHRTLKAETSHPAAADAAEQQRRFDAFREHYNTVRPHEALDQCPPADRYTASPRPMPARVEEPWYDADHAVRRVMASGDIKWFGGRVFVSEVLAGELVGLEKLESGDHVIRFGGRDIGLLDRTDGVFHRFGPPRQKRRVRATPAGQGDG